PTRELAAQVHQSVVDYGANMRLHSTVIFGGVGIGPQIQALRRGIDILVATPGRLLDHVGQGTLDLSRIETLVLDEADRMLDIGFYDDIVKIISHMPKQRQSLLFSATMPPKIRELAGIILNNPDEISISISKPAEGVLQVAYLVHEEQKIRLVTNLLADKPNYKSILVFTSTKRKVNEIVRALIRKGIPCEGISSDLEQKEREEVLMNFKSKKTRILVATDVLSRGIDIKDINLVINFDVPGDAEDYVHRIGRTARADTTGVAITFINPDDMRKFARIEQLIEREIVKSPLPEELGEAPVWNPRSSGGGRSGGGRSGGGSRGKGGGRSGGPRGGGGRSGGSDRSGGGRSGGGGGAPRGGGGRSGGNR
ncbi:MAG TPA: DEAD/DEAH box helicase, partial [Saprospiraceae bacterium]|nr:DEAD/DEAH box helicase [Saprospiraceae bacterium]